MIDGRTVLTIGRAAPWAGSGLLGSAALLLMRKLKLQTAAAASRTLVLITARQEKAETRWTSVFMPICRAKGLKLSDSLTSSDKLC